MHRLSIFTIMALMVATTVLIIAVFVLTSADFALGRFGNSIQQAQETQLRLRAKYLANGDKNGEITVPQAGGSSISNVINASSIATVSQAGLAIAFIGALFFMSLKSRRWLGSLVRKMSSLSFMPSTKSKSDKHGNSAGDKHGSSFQQKRKEPGYQLSFDEERKKYGANIPSRQHQPIKDDLPSWFNEDK